MLIAEMKTGLSLQIYTNHAKVNYPDQTEIYDFQDVLSTMCSIKLNQN